MDGALHSGITQDQSQSSGKPLVKPSGKDAGSQDLTEASWQSGCQALDFATAMNVNIGTVMPVMSG